MAHTPLSSGVIYKCTEYDLLSTSIKPNNYYACTDSRKMYKDTSRNTRELLKVTMIDTEIDRLYNTRPINGVTYYVWETNELWTYNGGWVIRIGEIQSRSSGYYYKDGNILGTDDPNQNIVIDNNGLLKDGSVVIRDINRIIKGKLYIDGTNNNLVITSFLGGGIRLLPNGYMDALGSLLINPNTLVEYVNTETGEKISGEEYDKLQETEKEKYEEVITSVNDGYAIYKGEWNTTDDMYVNTDKYNNDEDSEVHKYMVWHEGNFDPNDLVLTAEDILSMLQTLPQPIGIDVDTLDGKHAEDFAEKIHTHVTSDITDFSDSLKSYIDSVVFGGENKGIYINYNSDTSKYDFTANSFKLTFTGGVTGENTVTNLSDTVIELTVDPSKHTHKADNIDGYQELIDELNNKIPKEDATTTPTPNKLLYLDATGYLPADITGNASTASKLQVARTIQLTSGVTGSAIFDGSDDINIVTTVDPNQHQHSQYFLIENIGKTVAPLDSSYKVPLAYLPDSLQPGPGGDSYALQYQGTFNPANGLPSPAPTKGQYWVASSNGTIDGREYATGDWITYNGTSWDYIDNKEYIRSINGKTESSITLSYSDVDAISDEYIDYSISDRVWTVTISVGTAGDREIGFQYSSDLVDYYDSSIKLNFKVVNENSISNEQDNPSRVDRANEDEMILSAETDKSSYFVNELITIKLIVTSDCKNIRVINESGRQITFNKVSEVVIPSANKLVLTDSYNHISVVSEKANSLSKSFEILTTGDSDVTIDDSSINETDGSSNISLKLLVNPSVIPDLSMEPKASFEIDLDLNGLLVQEVI